MGSSRVRVLFLGTALMGGGAEHSLLRYLTHLDRDRFEPHLSLCWRAGPLLSCVPPDVPLHDLGGVRRRPAFPWLTWRLYRLARRLRPRIIVGVMWHPSALSLAAGRLPGADWRTIVTVHGPWAAVQAERRGRAKIVAARVLFRAADAVLCVSEAIADDCRARFGGGAWPPIVVQHNPHPIDEIRARATGSAPFWPETATHRLIAVGRLVPQKGHDVLLDAVARLPADLDWHLAILGEGPDHPALARRASDLGVAARVTFAGYVANPLPAMRAADLVLLASRFEGLPGVLCEALALGKAIIATRAPGGTAEVLGNGAYGSLVPPDDPGRLAGEIERLLRDGEARARYEARAAEGAARFDVPIVLASFEQRLLGVAGVPA